MKKRSKAGARPAKARPRKTLKRKGRNVPKPHHGSSPAGELTRLTRELNDSLKRETATADVLKVISRSTFDLQTVLETLVESAARLCAANRAVINRRDGGVYRVAAKYGFSREYAEYAASHPVAIDRGSMTGRAALEGRSIHVPDVLADPEYRQDGYQAFGFRTALAVPLLREGATIGVFVLTRNEVNPFTDKQIELVTTFGDQAVIAIENARLLSELRESLQEQTATSEVLQVISSAPGELQPVFETILENAVRICDAKFGNIFRWGGDALQLVAAHNTPPALAEARRSPFRPHPKMPIGRMLSTKTAIHVVDLATEKSYLEERLPGTVLAVELGGIRTYLAVPMLKEDKLIGALSLSRQVVRPFTDKQIELVKNFAAQAVIAIENTRLLSELRESLQEQTATAEVLQVISSSPGDLQPVFEAMVEKAVRICDAKFGNIYAPDGNVFRLLATHNTPPGLAENRRRSPIRSSPTTLFGRMLTAKAVVHVVNLPAEKGYIERVPETVSAVELGGIRTVLAVPMLKEDELVGAFTVYRQEVRPFTDKQIALVTNFAAQAVIAIENARLLTELRESLQEQTATAEVLQVINSSSGDLEPVFAGMLEKAVRICDANFGNIYRWDGEVLHLLASHNTPPALADARKHSPLRPYAETPVGRMVVHKAAFHSADMTAMPGYIDRSDPAAVAAVELGGVRAILAIPMLKENEMIGSFSVYRQEVRPFTDKQIALVTNFAAQAVIAIENARLLNELRESLQEQMATSEVLQVISSSPGDLEPVFATMLENAVRICDATFGLIYRWDGAALHLASSHDAPPGYAEYRRRLPTRFDQMPESMRQTIETKLPVQADPMLDSANNTIARAAVELGGIRTVLTVPMVKENELVGVITLNRSEVRPFNDKQIALVTNFARQAAIAIENARLLNELRESLQEQTATSEVLQVISSSPGDLEPVFDAMLAKAARICDASFGNIFRNQGDALYLVGTHNTPPAFVEARRRSPVQADPNGPFGRMLATKTVAHILDLAAEEVYAEQRHPGAVAAVELGGVRTSLLVPMLKDDELVGVFSLYRQEVRPFTDKQIALVQNFASQAVIAIENTRLLNELRQRTEEVEKLNQHLEQRVSDQVGEIESMGRLRRFLPPQVADLIVASGTEKQLESHRREITALFCDLRGFTGFSESSDPEDVMALLREYHAAIGEIIVRYSGTLERYAGDGVMVVFNDPIPVDNPALQAVLMALEMRDAIGALTEKWRRLGHDIGFGIGIAHGFATLGTIGFEGRFDYAAIGTVSNVASRLCDEAKPGQILISPRVLMAVEDAVTVEPVGEFELKGIRRPIAAYNVLAAKSAN